MAKLGFVDDGAGNSDPKYLILTLNIQELIPK